MAKATIMAKQQQGITFIGVVFVLVLFGTLLLLLFRLAPIYIESFSVSSSMDSLSEDVALEPLNRDQIRTILQRRFNINDVSHVKPEDVHIRETGGGLLITVDYEARVPLIGNLDAVASFHKQVEVPR